MLAQEGAQPIVDGFVVGRGHGHALCAHRLESIDDAIAHRGGLEARGFGDDLAQLAVVVFALVEGERSAGEFDGLRARLGELFGCCRNQRLYGIEAFRCHLLHTEPGHYILQLVAVHGEAFLGNIASRRREDQTQYGSFRRGCARTARTQRRCSKGGGAGGQQTATIDVHAA